MSLTTTLTAALGSLTASEGALQITNNNIANANTPGYTREVVDLDETNPAKQGSIGTGVLLSGYTSVRSELLQRQIQSQLQNQGSANAQFSAMQQVQPLFTTSSTDIGTEMSSLFSSLSALSTNVTDPSTRQAVISAGQNLATAFNTAANSLTSQQAGLNTQVQQDVTQMNQLTQQIAALNPQVATTEQTQVGENGGTAQDQQDQLIQQLSQLAGVQVTQTSNGVTLTTSNGSPLVVGTQSYALQTSASNNTTQVLDANGTNITATLQGGDLGGTLQARDQSIPSVLNQLDTLANQFATAFNAAQTKGFDQNGNAGTAFFTVPATVAGSAAGITLALTSSTQIAASSDGSAGSDGNLSTFAAVQASALPSGASPTDTYADIVYQVGALTSNASVESSATSASLLQLNNQLSSQSGVSVDEETTNLMKFQQSYQAAAQVINTVNSLFTTTMNMMTLQ